MKILIRQKIKKGDLFQQIYDTVNHIAYAKMGNDTNNVNNTMNPPTGFVSREHIIPHDTSITLVASSHVTDLDGNIYAEILQE